jgi:glycosyltransferase involved in cell wall biosynthesis
MKYRIGFALFDNLGLKTHNQNVRKYALKDQEVEILWAHIGQKNLPGHFRHIPGPLRNQLALLRDVSAILQAWNHLDAIVVECAPRLLAHLVLRRMLFSRGTHAPALILYQDYAPFKDTSMLAAYGYKVNRTSIAGKLSYVLQRWFARQADACILTSSWAREIMVNECSVPAERAYVAKYGADLQLWNYCPKISNGSEKPQILFVGGDFHRKGGSTLLSVYRSHFEGAADIDLVTKEVAEHMPAGVNVYTDINANDPRLRKLFEKCDIFVLPTKADFSSLVSIEAMATGRPVISTSVGGIPEIVKDGKTGFVICPGDETSLREKLQILIADPAMRARMGSAGREVVELEYNIEANVAHLLSIIKAVVDQRRGLPARAGP